MNQTESIDVNYFYGFRQLTEIAMRTLSPGINYPATAIIAFRALFKLYLHQLTHFSKNLIVAEDGKAAIILEELKFDQIFTETLAPIWNYGKADQMIQNELLNLVTQLQRVSKKDVFKTLLDAIKKESTKQLL